MEPQTKPTEDSPNLVVLSTEWHYDEEKQIWIVTTRTTTDEDLLLNFNPGTTFTLYGEV